LSERGHFLLRLDATGNLQWFDDQFDEDADFEERVSGIIDLEDMAVTPAGQIYLALRFRGSLEIAGSVFRAVRNPFVSFFRDPLLIKYRADGSIDWAVQGSSQWNEANQQVVVDSKGNAILAGVFSRNSSNNTGLSFGSLARLDNQQEGEGVYLVKFSPEGRPLWLNGLTDDASSGIQAETERLRDIAVDRGNIVLSLSFSDEIIIDGTLIPNPGANEGSFPLFGNVIAKLDANGRLRWYKVFVGEEAEGQIAVNPFDQSVSLSGRYKQVSFPDEDINLVDERSDYFIAQLDSTGSLISLDSTEYTQVNRGALMERQALLHLDDGSLLFSTAFQGGADVTIGNLSIPNPGTILALREPNLPFLVNLGPDRGQCQGEITLDAGDFEEARYLWSTSAQSQVISVNQSGTYWVQVTNSENEQRTDTIRITIEEPLTFMLPDTIRANDQVTLEIPIDAFAYAWSTGELTKSINVDQSGIYYATVFTEFGCESRDSVLVIFEEIAIYRGGVGSGYAQAQLTNSEAFYEGARGDGYAQAILENNQTFYKGSAGSGYVLGQLRNDEAFFRGNTGSGYAQGFVLDSLAFYAGGAGDGYALGRLDSALVIVVPPPTSTVKVFPNPTDGEFFLDRTGLTPDAGTLAIYSLSGRLMYQMIVDKDQEIQKLDLSDFTSGSYVIVYRSARGNTQTFQLFLQ
ncbi:MAG: T9SS type A sorting domain-containing protein, partial [Bacteroidota bacterium]